MAVTPADAAEIATLLRELRDDAARTLEGLIYALWATEPEYTGRLRALAVGRRALTALIGGLTLRTAVADPADVPRLRLEFEMRQGQLTTVNGLAAALPAAAGAPVAGTLSRTSPYPAPAGWPDANDPYYGGTPWSGGWSGRRT